MIQINLLPPEYRPRTGTPVARFVAIVVGIVMVLSAGGVYAYTHFIELSKVRELKRSRQEEVTSMEMQRDRSLRLQQEIDMYDQRRRAIQTINRSRTLWSRKLDQFYDIVTANDSDDSTAMWLDSIDVPTKVISLRGKKPRRRNKKAKVVEPSAQFKFEGFLAMNDDSDALTLLGAFHKSLTGDPESTGKPTEFYADFIKINNPNIEMVKQRTRGDELVPPHVGAFNYDLGLAPVDLGKLTKKKKK